MGIEQNGLGVGVIVGEFYQIKGLLSLGGYPGGAPIGPCAGQSDTLTVLRRFITMKLKDRARHRLARTLHPL